jgi:UDP-N-acetylmuramoyl-tripeptide--D-alanyl-D-alanine ligase
MEIEQLYSIFLRHPVVTTDSRDCPAGSLFFALKGESFDGNAYAAAALQKGCAYAVVDESQFADSTNGHIILVDDVLRTLQQLANYHRRRLGTRIIGVTGTNGKTTTKELIATVLSEKFNVLYTQGNFNNHIGVPKTLLQLRPEHDVAVVEMGANHPGEIKTLVNIVEPDYGIITNVGKAHLEGFGSFEGVIRTKGELYDFLRTRPDSVVFIHNDNPYLNGIAHDLHLVRYGRPAQGADLSVCGEVTVCDPYLTFRWKPCAQSGSDLGTRDSELVKTHLIGSYNIDNALAAAAIGTYFGISPEQINHALGNYVPQNNRSQLKETGHNHLIIDAYNANPTSMMAALTNYRDMQVSPKMAILGDMRELGASSAEEHQKIVDFIEQNHFDNVWLIGPEFAATRHNQRTFANVNEVKAAIEADRPEGFYILIKGSNGMKLFQLPELL